MVKANLDEMTDRMIAGEKIINPAYQNPELAKEISKQQIREDWIRRGAIKEIEKKIVNFYGKRDLAKQVLDIQPLFYDKIKVWWKWNPVKYKWEMIDETDILNLVNHLSDANTVNSKEKSEIVEALRQEGRKNHPLNMKPTWVQFDDEIVDIITGETFRATPKYFVTNPIPYRLNRDKFECTPVMDRIFSEWVGEEYVPTLYEIVSYCLIPDYPLNRLFCFIGSGMNGKSKFLELLTKFVGKENCTSTELDTLLISRFEPTKLHKKLVCIMGETNFNQISQTSMLKKLTGGDLIGFEYKNKTPFEDKNYAKILIATNNLPTTDDKSIGFYRRWMIIDFPNQFSEKKDILAEIPEEEYECLALKCTMILKDLLEKRKFHNEGSIEDRMDKFESKSDFLKKFVKENVEEDINEHITIADFRKKFNGWCKENRHRELAENTLSKKMKDMGFELGKKYFNWLHDGKGGQLRCYLGVRWKD